MSSINNGNVNEKDSVNDNANGKVKDDANAEKEISFAEALRASVHEEEDMSTTQKLSVIKILGGDFIYSQVVRRQILLILYIAFFVILYISNRYSCQNSMHEIESLKKELQDMKFKSLSISSQLTEQSRQSRVLRKLQENNDSVLKMSKQPPFIINVPEEAESGKLDTEN